MVELQKAKMGMSGRLKRAWGIVFLVAVALGGCADRSLGPIDPDAVLEPAAYGLTAGDKVKLTTFRDPDLSGEFLIDNTGTLSLPLIGTIAAQGLTRERLQKAIENRLSAEYVVDPKVTVEIISVRPAYILGEVNRPGSYPYTDGMTVLGAVATAGGFTYRAQKQQIVVRRGRPDAIGVIVRADAPLLPGDIVEVPERFF